MKKPARDRNFFEEWAKRNNMKAVMKVVDPDGEILLADSGEPFVLDGAAVYRTGYAINRAGLEIGDYHDYPAMEMFGLSKAAGQNQRINEALAHARQTQSQLKAAGFYDADRKDAFSPRPD